PPRFIQVSTFQQRKATSWREIRAQSLRQHAGQYSGRVSEGCLMLLPEWLRSSSWAFLYWIAFLVALEPGNLQHALSMGHVLDLDGEALRICVASLLGCSTAPLILALGRRFPIGGARGWRGLAMHAAGAAALSVVLIVASCFLAAWLLLGAIVPAAAE